jgi:hypothetical protein
MADTKGSDPKITYKASMARQRWRKLYMLAETINPAHKASQRWLQAAAAELFEVAEVRLKTGGGLVGKTFDLVRAEETVTLELTRDTVLGIKFAVIAKIVGDDTRKPATMLERRDLLEAVGGIGPDGKLRRLIEAEAKLPDSDDLEEEDLSELDAVTPAAEGKSEK